MDDESIVGLYWQRSPYATEETAKKYGIMLRGISYRLLKNLQDSEECVNDTYLTAWNRMPNDRPNYLGAYLSKIVRNLSINRFRKNHAEKRGGCGNVAVLTDELAECIPAREGNVETSFENGRLKEALNRFKMQAASEVGVNLKQGYNGDLTSKEAGSVGGQMVKNMIKSYEESMK